MFYYEIHNNEIFTEVVKIFLNKGYNWPSGDKNSHKQVKDASHIYIDRTTRRLLYSYEKIIIHDYSEGNLADLLCGGNINILK